ncbi:SpaA isopeptide-forming pilin-related protein [uncultured Gemmiger sp.]|uniref:SpaA isopeptide-forming pilin-related protein n=1 Tax=uncultured Gemmiger sp. TaxID=1623490 RepID=UPI0025CDB262|nr:SpaA isopeptide-forming pilin-related protein [uncultured Gemmiger sp.]
MTKANSNLHRAAALLAALCLLASMALPVYAAETETEFSVSNSETIPGDDNTGNGADGTGSDISVSNLETIQKDADTTNEGSKTEPEISVPESGTITNSADTTDKAAGAPLAEDVTGSENTAPADNAAADKTAPDEEKTNLTEENTSDDEEDTADDGEDPADEAGAKETFFAADTYSEDETESDDSSAPMTASNEGETASFIPNTVTIYFAVDSSYQENYRVNLYVQKKDGSGLNKDMSDTDTTTIDSDGTKHKIFSVTLSQADYPGGGFDRLIFQYFDGPKPENWKCDFFGFGGSGNNDKAWTSIDKIAGKMYDGQKYGSNKGKAFDESQWTRVEYYYAGMPLYFKNASTTTLNGVTATFYKKGENNTFEETGRQTIGTVAANTVADQKITIPNNQSQFVKFTWEGYESEKYYNFSKDSYGATEYFDLTANNCFVYSGNESTESPWQNAGGDLLTSGKTIYFDATLSSYDYDGEHLQQSPMPYKNDEMYCFFVKNDGTHKAVTMEKEKNTATNRQLWSCAVPDGGPFTAVQFSARQDADGKSAVDDLTKQYSTAEIPLNLKEPCFFADDGDPSAYTSGSGVYRDGYWGEKGAIRDAESGKGTTVVDIASDKFTQEAGTKYITSTLYDYYTDYELNGFNRDSYPNGDTNSQRWYVTFEQFNRALSSAYKENKNVQYPLYTGHFQPSIWDNAFANVAAGMDLYGWSSNTDSDDYKTFMAVNNSALDTNGDAANTEAGFARTFQGLVEDKTSTGDANGLPVLKGTGNLVDPHFNKEFLEGKNTFNTVLGKVYENVSFPFTQDAVFKNDNDQSDKEKEAKYWYYDSSQSSLYLTQDNGKFYLESTKDESGKLTTDSKSVNRSAGNAEKTDSEGKRTYGFFPFNKSVGSDSASQYNYGFGAKLQFDFTLTDDGKVQVGDNPNDKVPIKFFFSGDDDVWVYIDGQLVLDVGGAHGKASGLLEFGDNGTDNTVTPYVSSNKAGGAVYEDYKVGDNVKSVYFNGKQVTFDKKGNIRNKDGSPFTLAKGTTHTLTMFYMERGMWESNMAVAFNFPDNNELQVEKKVDVTGVNELFKKSFQNQKIFTFNIKNLATHYKAKETSYTEGKIQKLPEETYKKAQNPSDTTAKLEYAAELPPESKAGDLAVLWSATMDDPTSAHREQRRGTLPLDDSPINIQDFRYLTFDVYVEGEKTDTCALGNLYVELLDTDNNQKGCINGKGLQSSDVYGAATALHPGQWYTIRLLLNSLKTTGTFNNQLKSIKVGDNFARKIYLRNFTFRSAPKEQPKSGFTTEQYDIPDYGSATSGNLENATYAVFSSDRGNGDVVDEDGQFLLQDGETVTFKDQFRRGSYIALKEQVDPNLYDTFWTVYENDAPVTNVSGASEYVMTGSVTTLENVKDTAPNDGRTEKVIEGTDKNGNQITNAYDDISKKKPTDNTLVFRSYSDKADKDELTKLKVVFTNKVKTGKLIIRKEPAPGESLLNETFKFTVKFSNVGGQGLGGDILEQEYECTVTEHEDGKEYGKVEIKGIPVGTRFVVSEVAHPETSLQLVTITGGGSDRAVVDGIKARGSVVEDDTNVATAKFVNTKRQLTDLVVTKQWVKQDGKTNIPNNELPAAIYLKLQRTKTPNDKNSWRDVTSDSVELKRGYDGWVTTFTGLDKFDASDTGETHEYYTYRVLESVTEAGPFYGGSKGNVIDIDGKKYTILNNTVSCADDRTTSLKLTLTNKLQDAKYNLNITKQDAEDKTKLGGVEFKLEKLNDDGTVDTAFKAVTRITSSDDANKGKCSFENLKPGSYRLTETKTAEGYTLLADAIEFTLTTDGECKRDATDFGDVQYDSTTGVYNIALTINNRKSFELPHTGADAPSLWLLIGLPALVAVLLVLVFRYNKKGGRRQ